MHILRLLWVPFAFTGRAVARYWTGAAADASPSPWQPAAPGPVHAVQALAVVLLVAALGGALAGAALVA